MSDRHRAISLGTRRARWIATAAVVALAAACARAQLGTGSRQSEFTFFFSVRGYGTAGWFTEPSAVALDERAGLIYVADQKAGEVDAFSLQGVSKFRYGSEIGLKAPIGLAVDRSGSIYVSENDGGPIKIIDSRGKVTTLEVPAADGKETPRAGRLSMDQDGNLYVVDRANCQVVVFDKDRKLKFRFGGIGDKRGQFRLLQDVAADRQGRMYAIDAIGTPVQVFDRKGGWILSFGTHGDTGDSLSFPAGVFVDRNDQVWIADKTRHMLKVFDRMGTFLKSFGTYGQEEGQFFYPNDVVGDSLGRIYVLEFGARRLQVFRLSKPFEPFSPFSS